MVELTIPTRYCSVQKAMENSEKFSLFLSDITSHENAKPFEKVFDEKFSTVVFPRSARLPFSEFVCLQDNITAVVSRCASTEIDESETETQQLNYSVLQQSIPSTSLTSVECVHVGQSTLPRPVVLSSPHPRAKRQLPNQIHSQPIADISALTPLTLDEARYIASLYSITSKMMSPPAPNLWILCSNENRNIVSLGTCFADSTLFVYTITLQETLPLESSKEGAVKSPSRFDGPVFSRYQITTDSDGESGSIFVEFLWSEADRPLCLPPASAHAVVKVSATPGYTFSPVLATYNELCTLLNFCDILSETSQWPLGELPTQQDGAVELSRRIDSFLSEVAVPLTQVLDTTVMSPTTENTIYATRKDLDFAERLWMFAKDVTSLVELKEVFAAVFKALLLEEVQPFVHRTSSSVLATLLHQLLRCTSTEERQTLTPRFQSLLSQSKLLSCLIEIGLDKMKRDYRAFFVSSDITTGNQLEDFCTSSPSQSQLAQCHVLCKLHCVLEINASLLSFLNLPSAMLSSLTKTALQVYRGLTFKSFSSTPTFSLPLSPHSPSLKSVVSLCSKLTPTVWKAQLNNEQGMILYRREPLFGQRQDADMYYVYIAKSDISGIPYKL